MFDALNAFSKRLNPGIRPLFFGLCLLYFVGAAVLFLTRPLGGDENVFVGDLQYALDHGIWAASAKQVSLPYILLAYPFGMLFGPFVGLRVLSVLFIAFLLYYARYIRKLDKEVPFYFMFYIATANFFFSGVNDVLFITALLIFLIETMLFTTGSHKSSPGLGIAGVIVAFFTRQIFMLYLFPVVLGLWLIWRNGWRPDKRWRIVHISLVAFFLLINFPSLINNGKLSYDNKLPPNGVKANWVQLQYLAQIQANQGLIPEYTHPTWVETDNYLRDNGADALPSTMISSLTADPMLTVVEFFKDFRDSLFFSTRAIGFMLWFALFYVVRGWFAEERRNGTLFIPLSVWAVFGLVSLIIISYIEARWYGAILLATTVFFSLRVNAGKYGQLLRMVNYSVLMILMVYGMYKWTLRG